MLAQEIFEKILEFLLRQEAEEEIKKARGQYFSRIPDLHEDDSCYEPLLACFLEWYVFERQLENERMTPLQFYAMRAEMDSISKKTLAEMAASLHSLFQVRAIRAGGALVEELFRRETLEVSERRALVGLKAGQIIEARLIRQGEKLVFFSNAFFAYPSEANAVILAAVEKRRLSGKPPADELMKAFRELNFRYQDRFRQRIGLQKVYGEWESFISFRSS